MTTQLDPLTKITFHHYHEGNDSDHAVRGPATYATVARLVNLETGDVIEEEWAYCSPNDAPSRKKGREIAEGRLMAKLNPNFHKEKNERRKLAKDSGKSMSNINQTPKLTLFI